MVFCNKAKEALFIRFNSSHNPYFNRWFSAIMYINNVIDNVIDVTILILIDGFLQSYIDSDWVGLEDGHNPYFNRWFSAMWKNQRRKRIS